MKKFVSVLLSLLFVFVLLCSCAPASDPSSSTDPSLSSSSRRELKKTVDVDWSEFHLVGDVTVKVYVDGEYDKSKTRTYDESITCASFTFTSSKDSIEVRFKFNDAYTLDMTVDMKADN